MKRATTILNVNDDEAGRFAVSAMLRKGGFDVWEAATGLGALDLMAKRPDLVLLDVRLPDVDGIEVCRRIKSNPESAATVVVHLTALHIAKEDRVAGLESGADGYLTQPVGERELLATVRAFARLRRAEAMQRTVGEATARLAEERTVQGALKLLARLVVPFSADACLVELVDRLQLVPVSFLAGEGAADGPNGFEPVPLPVEEGARGEALAEALRGRGTTLATTRGGIAHSFLLEARGRTLAALTLVREGASFEEIDTRFIEDLVRRAATQVDNISLYEQRRREVELRDNLLAVVSHDLRAPLQSIRMASEIVLRLEDSGRGGSAGQYMRTIQRAVDNATALIRDLLDLAASDAGRLSLSVADHDVTGLVDQSLTLFGAHAQEKNVLLRAHIEPGIAARCDAARVMQVLNNLLGNAVKFSRPHEEVLISCRAVDDDMIEVAIADRGPGMSAEQLPHIFERFWQASQRPGQGAGLGLSIVKSIVDAHKGHIAVESVVGVGSTFRFTLPRAKPSNPAR